MKCRRQKSLRGHTYQLCSTLRAEYHRGSFGSGLCQRVSLPFMLAPPRAVRFTVPVKLSFILDIFMIRAPFEASPNIVAKAWERVVTVQRRNHCIEKERSKRLPTKVSGQPSTDPERIRSPGVTVTDNLLGSAPKTRHCHSNVIH